MVNRLAEVAVGSNNFYSLQASQHGSKDKNVIFFASGNISMNIFLPKTGYEQGNPSNITCILVN